MKRSDKSSIIAIIAFLAFSTFAGAQEITAPEGYQYADSVIYVPAVALDTALVGKDIFRDMPSEAGSSVNVAQSSVVEESMRNHIASNGARAISGYRVRIFFDNKQTARHESEQTLKRFAELYHDVVAYRTYTNPYFKVTVGDCRTKSEAMALLARIRNNFPSAFVVKENIEYPVVDKNNAYIVDTVKVLRPVEPLPADTSGI